MIKMDYCYQLFNPSGNVTALILGLEKNGQLRRRAAQKIMEKHPEVEQVVMPLHKEQEKTLSEENVKKRTLEILQQQHLLGTPAAGMSDFWNGEWR